MTDDQKLKKLAYLKKWREDHPNYFKKWAENQDNRKKKKAQTRKAYAIWAAKPGNLERKRFDKVLRKYGVTIERVNGMLQEQNNRCPICEKEFGPELIPNIDHDHVTGLVRAILCKFCNSGLGFFRDSPEALIKAAEYLQHHESKDQKLVGTVPDPAVG